MDSTISRDPAGDAQQPASVCLQFSAGDDMTAPLTWAQSNMYWPMQWFGKDANQFNISRALVLPEPTGQSHLLAVLLSLIENHQTLRTRYVEHEGEPQQHVFSSGSYDIMVADDHSDPARTSQVMVSELAGEAFDHESEWPLRVGCVIDAQNRVTAVALVGSHLAFDHWSYHVFADLLFARLVGQADLVPEQSAANCEGDVLQPLEQAAYQNSPAGKRQNQRGLRHWEQGLAIAPASMFDLPRAGTGEFPIERHFLHSTAVATAAAALAARTRTSPSTVLLCLTALILTAYNGHDTCALQLIAGNRLDRRSRDMIALNAHNAWLTFPVEDADLLTAIKRIHRCAFEAYCRAPCDPVEVNRVAEEVGRRRGVSFDLSSYFNSDLSPYLNNEVGGSDWAAAGPDLGAARLAELRRGSRYSRRDPLSKSDMKFHLGVSYQRGGACQVELMADAAYLPDPLGETILRGIESLLCDAVDGDVSVSEIAARIGMTPARRGPGWVRTPAGWVDLDAVAQLVRQAADGAQAAAFAPAFPGLAGTAQVTAYVANSSRSPAALHGKVLDLLRGRTGVAAPAEYVICEEAPRGDTGLAAWQSVPVTARWAGRSALFQG